MQPIMWAIAVGLVCGHAQEKPPRTKTPAQLLRELDHEDAATRQAAFEQLRESKDSKVRGRLTKALERPFKRWFRLSLQARTRALMRQMIKARKGFDAKAFARRQKEVLTILEKEGDTKKMKPIVDEMWSQYYGDSSKAVADKKFAAADARLQELVGWLEELKVNGFSEQVVTGYQQTDEAHLIQMMPKAAQSVMAGNAKLYDKLPSEEYRQMFITNQYRVLVGKPALRIDLKLCAAGRDHSKDMHEHKFFSHDSPLKGKETFSRRAQNHGTTANSENICTGRAKAEDAFWGWFFSLGHNKNMVGDAGRIGVGNHEALWTQMFGR